jgi:hypothetical protein
MLLFATRNVLRLIESPRTKEHHAAPLPLMTLPIEVCAIPLPPDVRNAIVALLRLYRRAYEKSQPR